MDNSGLRYLGPGIEDISGLRYLELGSKIFQD